MNAQSRGVFSGKRDVVSGIYESIDLLTAVLLLTGQLMMTGVFVVPEGLYLSLTGPIIGGNKMEGKNKNAHAVLDLLDIFAGLLLAMGALTVTGPYVTSGSLFIVVSGPPLGITDVPVSAVPGKTRGAARRSLYSEFRRAVIQKNIGPMIRDGR